AGYFEDWRTELRTTLVDIEIAGEHGVPRSLVAVAAARLREARRAASRQQDDSLAYDQVWCIFDVDEHPDVAAAVDQARGNGIELAVSNPSFELWALLHFRDHRAHLGRQQARTLLKTHLPTYDKRLPAAELLPRYHDARRRACWLVENHERCGGEVTDNPSSSVWRLVDALRAAAERDAV
ncbi:MAG TPA: RloB family protein, partial [Candidatus Dormibacteraeota bacterium]